MPYKSYKRQLKCQRDSDKKNRKDRRAKARARYKRNLAKRRVWRNAYEQRRRAEARHELLNALGDKCTRCGFNDWRALQIDHVNGGGLADRRKLKGSRSYNEYVLRQAQSGSKKYQLLCANCNWIKRHENHEVRKVT